MIKGEKTVKAVHRFYEGIGRRKTATARVRIAKSTDEATVNGQKLADYFSIRRLVAVAGQPLREMKLEDTMSFSASVRGGGIAAQADAVRMGLARALVKMEEGMKKQLRVAGFLTRDPRAVERKKPGLKKARRAPQWQKR